MTATWSVGHYFIAFDANAADAEGEMAIQDIEYDEGTALASNAFAYVGYSFAGWAWDKNATTNEISFVDCQVVTNLIDDIGSTINSTNTLYAIWKAEEYEVSLDANAAKGGYFPVGEGTSESSTATVVYGSDYRSLPMPSNELARMTFVGWKYVDPETGDVKPVPETVPLRAVGVTNLVAQWSDGLAAALNAAGTDFEYGTGAYKGVRNNETNEFSWTAQRKDGEDVGQSGMVPANVFYGTYLQTTLPGPGVLTYRWRICAPVGYYSEDYRSYFGNRIRFVDAGNDANDLVPYLATGDDYSSTEWKDSGWQDVAFTNNSENPLTVEWRFESNPEIYDQAVGGTGWVDNVTWMPKGGVKPPLGPGGSSPMVATGGVTSVYVANTVQGWWYGLYSKTNLADTAEEWTILPSSVEYPTALQATGDDVPISFAWPWNLSTAPQRFFKVILTPTNPCP